MNKDQIQGTAKQVAGSVQEKAGKLIGSDAQRIKGMGKKISGSVQKTMGDAKEIAKSSIRKI